MLRIFLLIFLVSCGEHGSSNQCFNKEEAIAYCSIEKMKEGLDRDTAGLLCEQKYPAEYCYYLD